MGKIRFKIYLIFIMLLSFLVGGCSPKLEEYKNTFPSINLEEFLNGNILGQGIVQDWKGYVIRKFDFDGYATWKHGVCTFDETIRYYDGTEQKRQWIIKKVKLGHYIGTAKDVLGKAVITVKGGAMNWKYSMNVKTDGSEIELSFDDWMFMMDKNTIINKNYFKKFGFTVGTLTMYLKKS